MLWTISRRAASTAVLRAITSAAIIPGQPVKITIGNTIYDTETSTRLAHMPTWSSDQQLFQTPEGKFFILKLQLYVDGQRLGANEVWIDLSRRNLSRKRLAMVASIQPLSVRGAMEWSIKTQIPRPFRGYLLESI